MTTEGPFQQVTPRKDLRGKKGAGGRACLAEGTEHVQARGGNKLGVFKEQKGGRCGQRGTRKERESLGAMAVERQAGASLRSSDFLRRAVWHHFSS